tara:strand:- start:749 stop:3277 length:2529 start_codon:yes stop_codon:yes gene_type:complete
MFVDENDLYNENLSSYEPARDTDAEFGDSMEGELPQTVSNPSIDLEKEIISNRLAKEILDRDFNELIDLGVDIDVKKLFDLYNTLFYQIKKKDAPNNNSHHDLIHESLHYFNNFVDYCKPTGYGDTQVNCDNEIERLFGIIDEINTLSYEKENKIDEQNFMYPNGTLLRGEHLAENGLPVWVMVQGKKREIKNTEIYQVIKRALGHASNTPDSEILHKVTNDELSDIVEGLSIENAFDVYNVDNTGSQTLADPTVTISETFNYRESMFVCLCDAVDDPDEALDLYKIFGGGQPSNGTDNTGKCTIIYYNLDSQKQTLVLNAGESTLSYFPSTGGKIQHRVDLFDGVESVPAVFSDPTTPCTDNDGNNYNLDPYGNVVNGVYLNGFIREIRFSENGNNLTTPPDGTGYLFDDDGFGNITSGHTIEKLKDDYGSDEEGFNVFYYNVPFVARLPKFSNYNHNTNNGHLNGGRLGVQLVTPKIRMFTSGDGGLFAQFPPTHSPDTEDNKSSYPNGSTYGYAHGFSPEAGIGNDFYAIENIKIRDPEFYNTVLNNPDSRIYNPNEDASKCLFLGPKNNGHGLSWTRTYGNNDIRSAFNSSISFQQIASAYSTLAGAAAEFQSYLVTGNGYSAYNNAGSLPVVFNLDVGYYGYNHGLGSFDVKAWACYGAPIFEVPVGGGKLWYVIGPMLWHVDGNSYVERMEKADMGSSYTESGGNWRYGKAGNDHWRLIYPIATTSWTSFQGDNDDGGHIHKFCDGSFAGGIALRYPERHPLMQGTFNTITQIMAGTPVTNTNLSGGTPRVKCVFPGLDHVFYQNYINTGGPYGHTTPWNGTGLESKFSFTGHYHF